jgi:hypothetical protein
VLFGAREALGAEVANSSIANSPIEGHDPAIVALKALVAIAYVISTRSSLRSWHTQRSESGLWQSSSIDLPPEERNSIAQKVENQ